MNRTSELSHRVDAISWALFFIWIGVALLTKIGWGWSLLGIGAIILGTQAVLYLSDNQPDGFWVVCGVAFLAGGAWTLLGLTWSMAPVLFVLVGIVILWKALFATNASTPQTR